VLYRPNTITSTTEQGSLGRTRVQGKVVGRQDRATRESGAGWRSRATRALLHGYSTVDETATLVHQQHHAYTTDGDIMPPHKKYDWSDKKDICYRLWVEEERSLPEVMEYFSQALGVAPDSIPSYVLPLWSTVPRTTLSHVNI